MTNYIRNISEHCKPLLLYLGVAALNVQYARFVDTHVSAHPATVEAARGQSEKPQYPLDALLKEQSVNSASAQANPPPQAVQQPRRNMSREFLDSLGRNYLHFSDGEVYTTGSLERHGLADIKKDVKGGYFWVGFYPLELKTIQGWSKDLKKRLPVEVVVGPKKGVPLHLQIEMGTPKEHEQNAFQIGDDNLDGRIDWVNHIHRDSIPIRDHEVKLTPEKRQYYQGRFDFGLRVLIEHMGQVARKDAAENKKAK